MNRILLVVYLLAVTSLAITHAADPSLTTTTDHFPKPNSWFPIAGELTMVDHVNRMGILRPDRSDRHNKYHWDLPHHFTMLPYGTVYRLGSPASLADIPIGTHLHGRFYLGPEGEYKVPLRETEYAQAVANDPNEYSPDSQYSQVLRLEDDFTLYQRQGVKWKVVSIDQDAGELIAERVDPTDATSKPEGLTGRQTFDISDATRVWQGRGYGELTDVAPGRNILFNLTWATLFGPGRMTDIWIDDESQTIASDRQHKQFVQHLKEYGFPARVDHVDHGESGSGEVSVSFYQGPAPEDFALFKPSTTGQSLVVDPNLRSYRQQNTNKPARFFEVGSIDNPPPGHSGVTARFRTHELLEGLRPGRTIRLLPAGWPVIPTPRERDMSPFDIRPKFLEAQPQLDK